MTTAAIYARFSTDNQKETSIDDQIRRCRHLAEKHGYAIHDDLIFSDAAISGSEKATLKREGYKAMLDALESGRFDCLLLDEISRASRSLKEIIHLNDRISRTGVRLLTVDGKDSNTTNWRLWVELGAVFAEQSLRDTAFRVKRGMRGQLERGFDVNSPPYGYDAIPVGANGQPARPGETPAGTKWVINSVEAEVVKKMYLLKKSGKSLNQICQHLNSQGIKTPRNSRSINDTAYWRPGTVQRLLANPIFRGVFITHDSEVNDRTIGKDILIYRRPELRIVDDHIWETCNLRISGYRAPYGGGKNCLSGLIECGCCGAKLSLSGKGKKGTYVQSFYCASCAQRKTVGHKDKNVGVGHTALSGIEYLVRFAMSHIICETSALQEFRDRLQEKLSGGGQQERVLVLARQAKEAEAAYKRGVNLLGTIGKGEYLEKKVVSLHAAWQAAERHYQYLLAQGQDIDSNTLEAQLKFDPERAVEHIFSSGLEPERLRAVLRGIFPRITALGKSSRFVSCLEVEFCAGAIVASVTNTAVQDQMPVRMKFQLRARPGHKTQPWQVEVIEEDVTEAQETGKVM